MALLDDDPSRSGGPSQIEIIAELTKLLESEAFSGTRRSREFLAYVVTETLAGRSHRLSERTVGRYALGRHDRFDGRTDSSVRVQATRVRRGLDTYYATEGKHDPVRIDLPPGSYVPAFARHVSDVAPVWTQDDPLVAVLRFEASGDPRAPRIAASISEALVRRLSAFPGLRVVGPASATSDDPRLIAHRLGARFVLEGRVGVQDGQVRLAARLSDGASRDVVWAISDTCDAASFSGFQIEDQWTSAIAGELGDYTGVVFRRERASVLPGSSPLGYAAKLAFYGYVEEGTKESIAAAGVALDRALEVEQSPLLLAMRASIHNAHASAEGLADHEQDLRAAVRLAREALVLDPRSAHAHLVLGTTAWLRQQWDLARHHAAEGVRLSPTHPIVLLTAGTIAAVSGDWDDGLSWMREGFRLNPHHPGYAHAVPALACLIAGDDAEALAEASLVHAPGQVWGPLYRAMALAGLGYDEQAREEMAEVLEIDPNFLDDPASFFATGSNCTDEQLRALQRHLELWTDPSG
ncbi:MAG TPA: hypothetical protein PLP61_00535 [Nocardioides sp.]|uniref:hypothetical protein n=1 Tax=Nocardioides sp. TaxID=35761 RepID=UPI002C09A2F9|nr:hypothetical protein [Nocardioides sp.]HQR25500.1 hypothetical protein [Nocardioides sp.]